MQTFSSVGWFSLSLGINNILLNKLLPRRPLTWILSTETDRVMIFFPFQLSTAVFFTLRSPKIDVRGLLAKSLFSKKFWKFSGHEFWVLKLFCSSKTDRVTILFLFKLSKHFSWVFAYSEVLCVPLELLWCLLTLILGAFNYC